MHSVLSTKKLAPHQRELLLNKGIGLIEYDAIKIEFIDFEAKDWIENAIITSQNTAQAVLNKKIKIENCFCVGENTADFLKNNGVNVVEIAHYGAKLARILVEKYPDTNFTFFCGSSRREEMPSILKEHNINVEEIVVYNTDLNPKSFPQEFNGVLFFSPSGVKSFMARNTLKSATAFCIGNTTASEAKNHTDQIITATKPSIENVIVQVVKTYSKK